MAEQEVGRTAMPAARTSERATRRRLAGTNNLVPYLFLAPFLALFGTFILAPAVLGIGVSLFEYDYLLPGAPPFVGLENYGELFADGSQTGARFWQSMKATGIFTIFSVPLLVVVPLIVAVVLNQRFRGQKVFRAVYFMPYALGIAVVGILFRFVFDPNVGLFNYYLGQIGLPDD
ncbi:MAG: carbohydrate ABC transporter permease, partial [Actinomycetota bacterium]